jgi:hypothetical protein
MTHVDDLKLRKIWYILDRVDKLVTEIDFYQRFSFFFLDIYEINSHHALKWDVDTFLLFALLFIIVSCLVFHRLSQ